MYFEIIQQRKKAKQKKYARNLIASYVNGDNDNCVPLFWCARVLSTINTQIADKQTNHGNCWTNIHMQMKQNNENIVENSSEAQELG